MEIGTRRPRVLGEGGIPERGTGFLICCFDTSCVALAK